LRVNYLLPRLIACVLLSLVPPSVVLQSLVALGAAPRRRSISCSACAEWNRAQKPFRVFGNTYYVGTHGLSAVLITSDGGHVLIDGDLPQSVPHIADNIRSLGFRIEDVKVILNSHVHFDHAGGIAELQRMSGARVLASPWSAAVLRSGAPGKGDPQYRGGETIDAVKNVHELHDGERVSIGESSLVAHFTPGHTPGGTSWTWQSCERETCREMVYGDSLTPVSTGDFRFTSSRDNPNAIDDFAKSFAFFETTPCDILISTHPEAARLWDRIEAREKGAAADPMVDPNACRELAARGRARLQERLAEERKQK
jgi:metallo-beta-lactamase class B